MGAAARNHGDAIGEGGGRDGDCGQLQLSQHGDENTAATDDDVGTVGRQARIVNTVGESLGCESAEDVFGRFFVSSMP